MLRSGETQICTSLCWIPLLKAQSSAWYRILASHLYVWSYRVAEEPLVRAIQATGNKFSREDAVKCLQGWFFRDIQTKESPAGSSVLEGVSIDSSIQGLSKEQCVAWADDRLVIQWIMQFTDGGQEGNGFQTELDVS